MTDLNAQLLAAHSAEDHLALVTLYAQAADLAADVDAACFFLTQAYVFALEQNAPQVGDLRARLAAKGREPLG
ncbi:hypothetical protein SAMN05444149_101525 [Pseudosulfitobacter pseudonitzschiae]|uniref:Uncharacterized protein n=1 Tax=Pseudosulfitobacter pseudonitzschiae TaxID=1402135 RepID=A0A073J730_9RHOB|nr:hypothetical protein [Pseudosulfitobacter pseudonitzschiae]KEJ97779.1 hypothetical protein SUH3_01990 [Pseudosulfitobacter pseudonitzschiae]QKS09044.1 hypothetical protein HT745_11455 [Pseudosulfitobacter pseudonitzschiae]SHE58101.1 hypothetical protein SAMN05444149_101525 [Pseudosulfitobacter pseudonitzschiae]